MADYTPPPPGSREQVLPEHILELISVGPYRSTACETADRVAAAAMASTTLFDEMIQTAKRLHTKCRLTHKYTYAECVCRCHTVWSGVGQHHVMVIEDEATNWVEMEAGRP